MQGTFLPTNLDEARKRGWDSIDVIIVSGDAYIDHPSFGPALIGRYLESLGYKVGILPQPDWHYDADFTVLGKPNLFFGITAGNMDSMVANMTSEKRPRKEDAYTEGGVSGKRPNRASIVYANMIRKLYPGIPIVLGGIEASLRRLAHYDYWDDKVRRSLLFDTRADIAVYGMGEKAVAEIAERLRHGGSLEGIAGTARISRSLPDEGSLVLPSYEEVAASKTAFNKAQHLYAQEIARKHPRPVVQPCQQRYTVLEPPAVLSGEELDSLYELPFVREPHPRYHKPIPANGFVRQSVVSHRGCYGGCSFCALGFHQGKYIVSRSPESVVKEIRDIICKQKDYKGYILDIGGPSANMYLSRCTRPEGCARSSCLVPSVCKNLVQAQEELVSLLKRIRQRPDVKKAFINSGIRMDLALQSPAYMLEVFEYHVSGQLSVAPEHCSDRVLNLMNKPPHAVLERFLDTFSRHSMKKDKKQYIIPYFMASHPGSTLGDMLDVALFLRHHRMRVQQVQNFLPLPMTRSAAMYYTGKDPESGRDIHIPKGEERDMQRALLQPYIPANSKLVRKALQKLGKEHLYAQLTSW